MDHGSAPLVLDDEFVQDPYPVYAKLGTEGSVHRVMMPPGVPLCGGLEVWLITGYEAVRSALADPRLSTDLNRIHGLFARKGPDRAQRGGFSSALASHMMHTDPPDHTRLRKLVSKAFTGRAVEALRPGIEEITDGLVDALADHDTVDLLDAFAFPLPIRVICLLLGVPVEEQENFKSWSQALVSGDSPEAAAAAATAVAEYLGDLIGRKRRAATDDVLTALISAHDVDDRLTGTELVSTAYLLFIAGFETTLNALGNGTLHLMRNRDQWEALRADRRLLPGAVEEFLRLESPLKHATFRCATESLSIGDVEIPAGDFVLPAIAAANRDPLRFGDPHALDVRRPAAGHLAFGHGVHHCLGAPLARVEAQTAFGALLDAFPAMTLAVDPEDLRWRNSTIIRGLDSLPVRLAHR
ncbi:cytochrome P450 [Actinosynnema sp. NPDC047251]|uniref:Cytochrome P450, 107B1 family n=1 Tax=Saccharothrix espanaensis (strain ATCC 51144 / DSM 44229 / JCM 9112 / NBRC 15066 / NRRL 15764) TaxID=1179773 RepID=K0K5Y7_SACES|nr:cytochrome P450 [Saccharothrix espanaensis]CCH32294.1 Cytochrome P450, 107B1 family [Saccharothrix espanaensis DSM 44229]